MFAKADNRSIMLDIHPFGGGIYVSAGKVMNKSTIALTGTPTGGSYTVNGNAYPADSVGSVIGALQLPRELDVLRAGLGSHLRQRVAGVARLAHRRAPPGQGEAVARRHGPLRPGDEPQLRLFQAQLDAERMKQEQAAGEQSIVKNMPVDRAGPAPASVLGVAGGSTKTTGPRAIGAPLSFRPRSRYGLICTGVPTVTALHTPSISSSVSAMQPSVQSTVR